MNKEELYKLAINNVQKYSLLNEIFAIRDKRVEQVDYTIGVNGFISLDVLNKYVELIDYINQLETKINTYENPEDMTLMFMWCNEKAKDKIKELQVKVNQLEWDIESITNYYNDAKELYFKARDKVNQLETNRDKTLQVINTQLKNAKYKDNLRIIKFHLIKGSCTLNDLKNEEDYQY